MQLKHIKHEIWIYLCSLYKNNCIFASTEKKYIFNLLTQISLFISFKTSTKFYCHCQKNLVVTALPIQLLESANPAAAALLLTKNGFLCWAGAALATTFDWEWSSCNDVYEDVCDTSINNRISVRRGSHGLSVKRAQRTKSNRPEGPPTRSQGPQGLQTSSI